MIINVRINNNDNLQYKLCEWSGSSFVNDPILKLQTDDLAGVKNAFAEIEKIEVFQANVLIGEYTLYDTYSSISYLGQVYVQHENVFADCLEVQLRRSSLADQVKRIEETINPIVDVDSMTIGDYRNFMLKQVSDDCTDDIYLGTSIEIGGITQHFSFKEEDQINLLQLYLMTQMYPTITAVPYHADGNTCMFYSAEQIKTIYLTLIIRLLSITTYVNQLNLYAYTLVTKEEIANLRYGMELPTEYAEVVSQIVSETISAMDSIINPAGTDEGTDEPETDENEGSGNDEEVTDPVQDGENNEPGNNENI